MISALEAHKRVRRKISSQALEQLNELEQLVLQETQWNDPDDARCYFYYDKPMLAEVRVMLNKLGYKVTGEGHWFMDHPWYCIDWSDAVPYKWRGPKIE